MPKETQTPILIVGAGPVGLALAGDLGWRGVACLLVEQSDGSIYQPRMDLVGIRTMEFCRRWGLVSAVEASPYPRDLPQDNVYVTSLAGWELGRERMATLDAAKPLPESPQRRERCPQNMFDPILREFAAAQPSATLRYRTRLVGFTQDADGVTADVESESGIRERIRPQPGARDARHRHGRHRGAHLHHQRDLPLPRPGCPARQGPRLPVHHSRP
jgi:2-polyprenyl-6-methoxyphenol hydroxylase-like FAD-dependent oxidoreductase